MGNINTRIVEEEEISSDSTIFSLIIRSNISRQIQKDRDQWEIVVTNRAIHDKQELDARSLTSPHLKDGKKEIVKRGYW